MKRKKLIKAYFAYYLTMKTKLNFVSNFMLLIISENNSIVPK